MLTIKDDRQKRAKSPAKPSRDDVYQRQKNRSREYQRAKSTQSREIAGDCPTLTPAQAKIRTRFFSDPVFALKTLFPARFTDEFGPDQIELITDLWRTVTDGDQAARAAPRGSGKTTIMISILILAILAGLHPMSALIGATAEAAKELLAQVQEECFTNDELYRYFPEVFHPIRKIEGQKQRRPLWNGERVTQSWGARRIVFPNLPKTPSSNCVVASAGLLGRLRGMTHPRPKGGVLRPSLVLLDDIQTEQSALNPTQVDKRLSVVAKAVLNIGPPKRKLAAMCAVTVIVTNDAADQLLDNEKFPQWHGKRKPALYGEPTNPELWAEYDELRREGFRRNVGLKLATAFYKKNRRKLDAGLRAAWPARFKPDELSAIQSCMNVKLTDPVVFACEFQNCPLVDELSNAQTNPDDVLTRLINLKRWQVPLECEHLTGGIDCQNNYLVRVAAGYAPDTTGHVADYGTWPKQTSASFTRRTASPTISEKFPKQTAEEQLYSALTHCVAEMMAMKFTRADGVALNFRKICIDARWQGRVVKRFCRQSGYKDILVPCMGLPTKLGSHINDKNAAAGEISRDGFRLPPLGAGQIARVCSFDSNEYISGVHDALNLPIGSPGSLTLFDGAAHQHRNFVTQLCSEYSEEGDWKGRRHKLWHPKPSGEDNDFLDATKLTRLGGFLLGMKPDYQHAKPKGSPGKKREPKYASI